ncbi:MAG: radical SAM family heme chaperone HemW [Bacteroidales bacterium]
MAGIYIHVPFCHRRCHYCDFYTDVNLSRLPEFFIALLKEIELRSHFFPEKVKIDTIYFGGGTPSILHSQAIAAILDKIVTYFALSEHCEVTLELNPEDVSETYYREVKAVGVNRLSIGIQSFNDTILHYLNRRHGAIHAVNSIEWALSAGIENLSIDLIYGIPIMSNKLWEDTISQTVAFPVKHISAYHLTIEPRTTFGYLKTKGKFVEISEEQSWQQMQMLHDMLASHGFEHYEISNFAQTGFRSKHNQSYWQHMPYLGLGPSAHSFDGSNRYENVRDIRKYLAAINENRVELSIDKLSQIDQMNEEIMLRLRCVEGLNKDKFIEFFGSENYMQLENRAQRYFPQFLDINTDGIRLNLKGWFISDSIISTLFFG